MSGRRHPCCQRTISDCWPNFADWGYFVLKFTADEEIHTSLQLISCFCCEFVAHRCLLHNTLKAVQKLLKRKILPCDHKFNPLSQWHWEIIWHIKSFYKDSKFLLGSSCIGLLGGFFEQHIDHHCHSYLCSIVFLYALASLNFTPFSGSVGG